MGTISQFCPEVSIFHMLRRDIASTGLNSKNFYYGVILSKIFDTVSQSLFCAIVDKGRTLDLKVKRTWKHFFNVQLTVHRDKSLKQKELDALISQIHFGMKLYMFRTVPLSIIRSFSLYTQQWYMSYRFADSLRAGSGWNGSSILILLESCQQICMTYTIVVYSEKLLMMDRGTLQNF